jgi:two-component system cell cycle response regulator
MAALLNRGFSDEGYAVDVASSGTDGLWMGTENPYDAVVLDVMLPGRSGFEVCRELRAHQRWAPIIMLTALDAIDDRVRGLDVGADDFLTKPVDEIALLARVRSLARLKVMIDELRTRAATSASLGVGEAALQALSASADNGRILLVDDRPSSAERTAAVLGGVHHVDVEADPQEALFRGAEGGYDLFVISLGLRNSDALRLCSQIRSLERTRNLPVLLIAESEDRPRILRGLDLGVNDYLVRPIDRNELVARVRTQLRRKRYADSLRDNVQAAIEMAIIDPLTGLNNRRYLESHLATLLDQAAHKGRPLSLMILDIDHFKAVNDTHGHGVGDEILKGFSSRVRKAVRTADLVCRLGGEEFVVVMPDTSIAVATRIAERIRTVVEAEAFSLESEGGEIQVTVSIGLADRGIEANPDALFKRADRALYASKASGRNKVTAAAA